MLCKNKPKLGISIFVVSCPSCCTLDKGNVPVVDTDGPALDKDKGGEVEPAVHGEEKDEHVVGEGLEVAVLGGELRVSYGGSVCVSTSIAPQV